MLRSISVTANDDGFIGYATVLTSRDGQNFQSTGQRAAFTKGVLNYRINENIHVRLRIYDARRRVFLDDMDFAPGSESQRSISAATEKVGVAVGGGVNVYVANADKTWPSGMIVGTQRKPTLLFANLESDPDAATYPAPPISGPFTFYYGPSLDDLIVGENQ